MTAFLIYVMTVLGPGGSPHDITLLFPMADMQACVAYTNSPEQIESDASKILNVKRVRFGCAPRDAGRHDGLDPSDPQYEELPPKYFGTPT